MLIHIMLNINGIKFKGQIKRNLKLFLFLLSSKNPIFTISKKKKGYLKGFQGWEYALGDRLKSLWLKVIFMLTESSVYRI